MYGKLRSNVLNNIVGQYNTTGYLWENYDDETGRGKGSHPFTGCVAYLKLRCGHGAVGLQHRSASQHCRQGKHV